MLKLLYFIRSKRNNLENILPFINSLSNWFCVFHLSHFYTACDSLWHVAFNMVYLQCENIELKIVLRGLGNIWFITFVS